MKNEDLNLNYEDIIKVERKSFEDEVKDNYEIYKNLFNDPAFQRFTVWLDSEYKFYMRKFLSANQVKEEQFRQSIYHRGFAEAHFRLLRSIAQAMQGYSTSDNEKPDK